MTVSQMDLAKQTSSPQHRQHWLAEQVLNSSGIPVVHVRGTVFLEHPFFSPWAAESIARDGTIRLPFGQGRTSPVAAEDVAAVSAAILEAPSSHVGKIYQLTGPRSMSIRELAAEFSAALGGRKVEYVDVPFDRWHDELKARGLPQHVYEHFITMAKLHAANQYDRLTDDVERVTGKTATSVREYVASRPELFVPLK